MKKLISMMLMLCAVITFSACSSDDDGPSNPVSNPTIPQSAKIGAEVTIQGTGFAAGQTLWLVPEYGEAVNVKAKMATSGAKFTVPYTLNKGKADVVLQVENNKWTLGSMTLLAAENPITAISVPSGLALGKEVAIAGIGFAEGDKIVLIPVANAATKSYMTDKTPQGTTVGTTVAADGVKFTVPADLAEGEYTVFLVRGNSTWALGTTAVYQTKRIKSVYFENGSLAMIRQQSVTMNFTYNADGTLAEIASAEGLGWKFTYNDNVVKTVSPITDGELEFTMENGKVVKSTAAKAEAEHSTTQFDYWTYNSDNTLASVTNKDKWYRGLQLTDITMEDGNLASYEFGGSMKFTADKSIKAIPGTIDVRYLLDLFSYVFQGEDIFVGLLLNQQVTNSSYMPAKAHFGYQDFETGDNKWADVDLNTTFKDNVLSIDFLSFKDLEMITGTYGSKLIVTYENY